MRVYCVIFLGSLVGVYSSPVDAAQVAPGRVEEDGARERRHRKVLDNGEAVHVV